MATLESQQFVFEPDIGALRSECAQLARRTQSLAPKLSTALKNLEDGRGHVENGALGLAVEKLSSAMSDAAGLGAPELEASCFFYMGLIALAMGQDVGVDMLHQALRRTQNPHLALTMYNRLMIHHLSRDALVAVMSLADATQKVVTSLPSTPATRYYGAGANYNRAEAFYRQGEYAQMLPHVKTAAAEFASLSLRPETAKCEGLLGNALIAMGDAVAGLDHIERSLTLFRDLGNDGEIAFLLQGKGLAMTGMGRKDDAIRCLREAIRIFRQRKEVNALNSTLAMLANLEG
jgi:tetratricopeptide (TPR) repeat protein